MVHLNFIKADSNTHQAFWISLGSLFSFGFTIVSSMILSRYFSKADYGTYKQVLYVYNTLLVVFTFGLPKAFSFFLPRVPVDQAKNLIKKINFLFFFLGGFFSILLFVSAPLISSLLKNPDLTIALRIFAPVPFLMLPTMGLQGILATYRKNRYMAVYTFLTNFFLFLCITLPVVLFHKGYIHAIIGFVFSTGFSFFLALYLKYMPLKSAGNERSTITYKEIFRFSLPMLYASLWGMIIGSADQFFISRYFGTKVFADFSNGSLELPFIAMLIGATSTVLSPLFSKQVFYKENPEKVILPLWRSVFEKSAKLIYPLVLFSWFFADNLMISLFGGRYEDSSIFFRIKLIVNLFTLIAYLPLILSINANKYYANVHLIQAVTLVILEYMSIKIFQSPYLITAISVSCRIGTIIALLIYISRYFKIRFIELFPVKLLVNISIPSIVLLLFIKYFAELLFPGQDLIILFTGATAYFFLFYLWTIYKRMDYLAILKPLLPAINSIKNK